MPFDNYDPIISRVRTGTSDNPYREVKESLIVDKSGKVHLNEYPNKYRRVRVKDADGNDFFETTKPIPSLNEFYVDYEHKVVTFNIEHIGKQFEFHYFGEGNSFFPATSIYTERDGLTIKETLQQLTDTTAHVREETIRTNIEVQQNENVRIENENKRNENEDTRQQNEEVRIENENTRQQNEQQRQENESIRQSQEAKRQENTAKAISDAEKATENANTQANYAKNQGNFAKSQGDYAKEQGDYAKREADRLVNTDVSALDLRLREIEQYGGKFSWKYNPDTESLDLVVIG